MSFKYKYLCLHLLFLLSGLFTGLFGQSWHPFPPGNTYLYTYRQTNSADRWLFASHVDSVRLEGADSAYYLYRIDRHGMASDSLDSCNGQANVNGNGIILLDRDHYLGKKMLLQPDGTCLFVSSKADTFRLLSQTNVGASWTWQSGITATVDSIVAQQVLGVADSVKYFSLSNGKQISLSREHGFVATFNFLPFPQFYTNYEDTCTFQLWAIPEQGLGAGRLPTIREILDVQPGDKFGFESHYSSTNSSSWSYSETVVQAIISLSPFSYSYTLESAAFWYQNWVGVVGQYYPPVLDTAVVDSAYLDLLRLLPQQHNPENVRIGGFQVPRPAQIGMRFMYGNHGRIRIEIENLQDYDSCFNAITPFELLYQESFVQGLGSVKKMVWSYPDTESDSLYCYCKGSETWGTCLDISTLVVRTPAMLRTVTLSPNPAHNRVRCSYPSELGGGQLVVHNLAGQVVCRADLSDQINEQFLELSSLVAGLYLVEIYSADGVRMEVQRLVVE